MSRPKLTPERLSLAAAIIWIAALFVAWAAVAPASFLRGFAVFGSVAAFLRVVWAVTGWIENTGREKALKRLRDQGEP